MTIERIRINGIENPVGFWMEDVRVSFVVKGSAGKKAEKVCVQIGDTPDFSHICAEKSGADLDSACVPFPFSFLPFTRYYVRVFVRSDIGEEAWSDGTAFFETARGEEPWAGTWISPQEEDTFHPVFVKTFRTPGAVRCARLYISGLGLYSAQVNGRKVGMEVLTPYYSEYRSRIQYQTFDITGLLMPENELEVRLGNGWYKGKFGLGSRPDNFGDRFALLAEIRFFMEDGSTFVLGTDESWLYRGSDVEDSGIYDGEILNRLLWSGRENPFRTPVRIKLEGKPAARYSLPVKEEEYLPVREVIHTPAGEQVLDFGQNFAGYVQFRFSGKAGTRVVLDFGEILQEGNFYRDNYRSARSQFVYTADGRTELVKPEFTYFGFRYVRVSGWGGEVDPKDFTGVVLHSDMERTGFLETGHEKVNRLFQNALWGQKSNSIDFPTDCPQRDERLGWTGDAQVFSGTASYNMDTAAFYRKFLRDLRMEQKKYDGVVPGVIPVLSPGGPIFSSVWGDIATILPMVLYEHFGDICALAADYPMMKEWVDKIDREDQARGRRWLYDFGDQLGDWLALDGRTSQSMQGGTDEYFIGSCYWAASARRTADAAKALGKKEEEAHYRQLHAKIREAILKEYFTESGRLCIDTQTGYIVALHTGIWRDKQKLLDALTRRLYKDCYRLTGGFVGAPLLCRVLAENGMEEEAFHFLLQEEYPGWLHCVNLGATTIWERWNSVLEDGRISGTGMNSLNHYAYGAVVEFLYRCVAGLTALKPGFREAKIAPLLNIRLKFVRLRYESVYGTYRVEWEIRPNGEVHLLVEVPFGCKAQVTLSCDPEGRTFLLTAGVREFTWTPDRDVRCPYTEKTLFGEMMKDERAVEIIARICPRLLFFLKQGDEDFLNDSLKTLSGKGFLGFGPQDVKRLAEALSSLVQEDSTGAPADAVAAKSTDKEVGGE